MGWGSTVLQCAATRFVMAESLYISITVANVTQCGTYLPHKRAVALPSLDGTGLFSMQVLKLRK